jgi:catechol 2,3-dioxygenase
MPARTVIGHLHLHVGDLTAANTFYGEGLGFDRTVWQYPGALFFGAGGYHHHVGTNTWAGSDATPPEDADARLLEWTIELPGSAEVDELSQNLQRAGFRAEREAGGGLVAWDPWGTRVRVAMSGEQ